MTRIPMRVFTAAVCILTGAAILTPVAAIIALMRWPADSLYELTDSEADWLFQ
jgi:hypothetical protein